MVPTALSQIVESVFRVVVGLALAVYFLKTKDIAWAAGGAAFGAAAGAFGGSLLVTAMYGYYKRKKSSFRNESGMDTVNGRDKRYVRFL